MPILGERLAGLIGASVPIGKGRTRVLGFHTVMDWPYGELEARAGAEVRDSLTMVLAKQGNLLRRLERLQDPPPPYTP